MTARHETTGMLLGTLGVAIFSLTLPATRAAVAFFDPFFVAAGRAVVAGLLAACVLLITRSRLPRGNEWAQLGFIALGVVFGFPFFTTWAMQYVASAHGAVVLAMLPLATALAAALVAHERPSTGFWIVAGIGSAVVVAFALRQGGGSLHGADLALIAAIVAAALGYALGAKLSASMGGWQTISWALVVCLPVNLVIVAMNPPLNVQAAPLPAWLGFAYVSVFSMYVGFFPWYKGLALGGIARVGQTQLLQPFFTFVGAALLLNEKIDTTTLIFAAVVVGLVALGRNMPVTRRQSGVSASRP
jgi:drug/metabolite transporter (DMT)-like permease